MKPIRLVRWAMLVSGTMHGAANAQTASIDEIIVTAQKRAENLQDVPISISALNSDTLAARGVAGIADLGLNPPPGLRINPQGGDASKLVVDMRGISQLDVAQSTMEAGTAVYIDDIYIARSQGLGVDLTDPERIEVLRGPQGTLFGRNAEGGAIRIVSKKPTGKFGGDVRARIGNDGVRTLGAHINLPSISGIKIKLDYTHDQLDGYTRNPRLASLAHQKDYGFKRADGARVSVRLQPASNLLVDYAFDYADQKNVGDYTALDCSDAPASFTLRNPCNVAFGGISPRPDDDHDKRRSTGWVPLYTKPGHFEGYGHGLTVEFEMSDKVKLRSITGYRKFDFKGATQLTGAYTYLAFAPLFGAPIGTPGVGIPAGAFTPALGEASIGLPAGSTVYAVGGILPYEEIHQNQFSQELQLIGSIDPIEYVVGGYFFRETVHDTRQTAFSFAALSPDITTVTPTNPFILPFPGQGPTSQSAKARSFAGFAQATWTPSFSDGRLHLTGGIRYTRDRKMFLRYTQGGTPVDIRPRPFRESRWDPAATAAFDVSPNVNAYVRYAQAYRAGGVSVRSATFKSFKQEVNKAWEIGVKSDLLGRRVRLNIAAFQNRVSGLQIPVQTDLIDPAITDVINSPTSARIRGAESELTFKASNNLSFSGSYSYTKAHIRQGTIPTDRLSILYIPVAKHSASVSADYRHSLAVGELVLHADYAYQAAYQCGNRVSPGNFIYKCKRDLANARLSWQDIELGTAKLEIAGYVANIFDTANSMYSTPGAVIQSWNPPRAYGAELRLLF